MKVPFQTIRCRLKLTIFLLTLCAGCGSADNAPVSPSPQTPAQSPSPQPGTSVQPAATPTVNAGGDQIVRLGSTVTLSGSSTPTEAHPSCLWQFVSVPSGSNVVLLKSETLTPSFTPDRVGLYVISLTLEAGPSDEVIVEVSP
jgi:hypothetical protein